MGDPIDQSAADQAGRLADGIGRWLASGRPQSASGAFCSWWDARSGSLGFEYPEITGYALTWLASAHESDESPPEALARGHRAAGWLLDRLRSGDRSAREAWDDGAVYTFDLGMIAAGMIRFGRASATAAYIECGLRLARDLSGLVLETGKLPAVAPVGPPTKRPPQWSTVGWVHLTKCVQALLLADEHEAARRLCAVALDEQHEEGFLATTPEDSEVMLHPLLYAVEGLWIAGSAMEDRQLTQAAERAATWVCQQQLPSGGLPRSVSPSGPGPEQNDVSSQTIRAALLLGLQWPGLERAVRRLLELARSDGDHGHALIYQPQSEDIHLNTWVSMFAQQAMQLVRNGAQPVRWDGLV